MSTYEKIEYCRVDFSSRMILVKANLQKKEKVSINGENMKGFMHGINLGGWLSQCREYTKENYDNFIKKEDFKRIKEWGLDHVRLNVDYNIFENEDGNYIEDGFSYVQRAIDWAKEYGLNIMFDLHKTAGYSFDPNYGEGGFFDNENLQERFYRLWEQFAHRFGKYENMMCFELLNEITSQEYSDKWNEVSVKCIKRIRKICPTVKIVIGSYWNGYPTAIPDLAMPYDKNVIYTFHCYEPLVFTHQAGVWVSQKMTKDFRMGFEKTYGEYKQLTIDNLGEGNAGCFGQYNQNDVINEEFFERLLAPALKASVERNVEIYCGEYGVIQAAGAEEAYKWFKTLISVLDKYGIGRAVWNYRAHNFGLADEWMDSKREDILKLL